METRDTNQNRRQKSDEFYKKLLKLTVGGGLVFWVISIVTSLLPIASEYRAAFSNWSIQTVWIASLFAGMIMGCCVSYALIRYFSKVPTKNPILKSLILSGIALGIATILIDVPQSLLGQGNTWYYFLIGFVFNAARFLLLGVVIGYLYKRLDKST
jgi:hypothetical protein